MQRVRKILLAAVLAVLILLICYPVWIAVTGTISSQWELEENLSPVFLDAEGTASWPILPEAPTLKSLVEVLLDSVQNDPFSAGTGGILGRYQHGWRRGPAPDPGAAP